MKPHSILKTFNFETPIGFMMAIANEKELLLLEFVERKNLQSEIERFQKKTHSTLILERAFPIDSIEHELDLYFKGQLETWTTPIRLYGTPFQNIVWEELRKIPFGATASYASIATSIGKPTAFRAVALANATNQLAIIVPCHRVIRMNGDWGGYAGGIDRKQWLIGHEKNMANR